jgi:hypothetical protein
MPKYEVTRTETVEVWARDEDEAETLAIDEMQENPNGDYEFEDISPKHNLEYIAEVLRALGVSAYVDDYKNNSHDFIRLSATHGHPDDDENHFMLNVSLNEFEEFDGKSYGLMDNDGLEVASWDGSLTPHMVARLVADELKKFAKPAPEMVSELSEIADLLLRMGHKATIQSQAWRGMPAYLEIGETVGWYEDGTPHEMARFTLYYNLNEKGDGIGGTGYHLSLEDDESQIVAEIGNHTAPRVVAEILYNMGRADFDLESRGK